MALKETERSLRAYFQVSGGIAVMLAYADLPGWRPGFDQRGNAGWVLATYIPIITKLVLGVAFVIAGVKLRAALISGAGWIKTMLIASGAMLFINGALVASLLGTRYAGIRISVAAIGLLITIYLHRSVVRLAAEAAAREGIPPPPPTARAL